MLYRIRSVASASLLMPPLPTAYISPPINHHCSFSSSTSDSSPPSGILPPPPTFQVGGRGTWSNEITPVPMKPDNWRTEAIKKSKMDRDAILSGGFDPRYRIEIGCFVSRIPRILPMAPLFRMKYDVFFNAKLRTRLNVPKEMQSEMFLHRMKEHEKWTKPPLDTETEADRNYDWKSLERCQTQHLYLIVKKSGDKFWNFPTLSYDHSNEGKFPNSLVHQTKIGITKYFGPNIDVWVTDNAPAFFTQRDFAEGEREWIDRTKKEKDAGVIGARTYFFHAVYITGSVDLNMRYASDYRWVRTWELRRLCSPLVYDGLSESDISTVSDEYFGDRIWSRNEKKYKVPTEDEFKKRVEEKKERMLRKKESDIKQRAMEIVRAKRMEIEKELENSKTQSGGMNGKETVGNND